MRSDRKPNLNNRPLHIFKDNSIYFITVRCVDGQWFLRPDDYKSILKNRLIDKSRKFSLTLIAYAILNNHYHLILKIADSANLPKFIRELNGASSRDINKADHVLDRKIWWNYFDHVIRNEEDFFKHLNYLHQNPIKHGLSKTFLYDFSSYSHWLKKKGKAYLDHAFEKYPIVDFMAGIDDL